MSEIVRVIAVPAAGAHYYTDLAALQDTPIPLADQYTADGVSPGFRRVRELAEAISVALILSDGHVAWGDCVAVAYSGRAGGEPLFRTVDGMSTVRRKVAPFLEGHEVKSFRGLAVEIETLTETVEVPAPERSHLADPEDAQEDGLSRRDLLTAPLRFLRPDAATGESRRTEETSPDETITVQRPLHPAIRYGVSQALLRAVALTTGQTMAEVIANEWGLPQPARPIPIHAQGGADRRRDADKMIVRRVSSLPHGLVEHVPDQLGEDGEGLIRYVRWLRARRDELAGPDYRPTIHLDVHGGLGSIYDNNLGRILGYLYRLESYVQPYTLRIESPVIMDTRAAQIETMKTLREYVQFRNMKVEIVADEWANTLEDIQAFVAAQAADMIHIKMPGLGSVHNSVEAVLACREGEIGALLGGSSTETDLSARAAAHVALAAQPDVVTAKPGMGIDEGITILQNEMARTLVSIKTRTAQSR